MPIRINLLCITIFLSEVVLAQLTQLLWCLDHVPQRQHYEPGKAPYGPVVNLMQDLAKQLNVELTYTLPTPVNRCLQQLEHGEVDIVASLLYSPQRQQHFYLMPFDIARSESWFIHKDYQFQDKPGLKVTLIKGLIYSTSLPETYKAADYKVATASNMDKVLLPTEKNPLWFYVGFTDAAKRDAFDEQLTLLKQSGRYDQIRHDF